MGLEFCLALVPWGAAGLVWSNSGSPNPWKLKSSSLGAPGAVPSHQILQGQDQDRPSLIFFQEFSRFEDSVAEMGGGDRALCVRWCLNPLGAAFPGGESCWSDLPQLRAAASPPNPFPGLLLQEDSRALRLFFPTPRSAFQRRGGAGAALEQVGSYLYLCHIKAPLTPQGARVGGRAEPRIVPALG